MGAEPQTVWLSNGRLPSYSTTNNGLVVGFPFSHTISKYFVRFQQIYVFLSFSSLSSSFTCRSFHMATVRTTRTRPRGPTRGSQGIARALSTLERLVEQQVKYMRVITKQEQHLSALRKQTDLQLLLDPKHTQFQDIRKSKQEIREQWHNEILEWDPLDNWLPDDDRNLCDILLGEQLWTTWQYQAAYPNTAKFLAKATSSEKSRSLVYYDSFFPTGEIVEQWSSERPYADERENRRPMIERMWDILKQRMVVERSEGDSKPGGRLPSRVLRIMDVSPAVAAILLASTPKWVPSEYAKMREEHCLTPY